MRKIPKKFFVLNIYLLLIIFCYLFFILEKKLLHFYFLRYDKNFIILTFYKETFWILIIFENDYIIWSSELKSFRLSPIQNKLNVSKCSIRNYFDVGYVPSPLSIFENVYKLLPGETIEIDLSKNLKKHHFFESKKEDLDSNDYSIENFETILEDSIKIRTVSDVPYGVFLSSGIDSSLVASVLAKIKKSKISSFSIGLNDYELDESKT